MWHWQLSALFKDICTFSKRQQFFVQLCLLVLLAHCVFFLIVGICSYGLYDHERFVVSSQPKSSLYVLSPLLKHVEPKKKSKKKRKESVKASKVIDEQAYLQEQNKQKSAEKVHIPVEQQPELAIIKVQNIVEQPPAKNKKVVPNKQKKSSVVLSEQKVVEQQKIVEQKVVKVEQEQKIEQELQTTDLDLDLDDVTFVGYKDLDHVVVQEMIAQAVQQYFKPPVGMDSDVSVELRVYVVDHGKVNQIEIVRSSGIVVYDSSARAAVYKATLPREVWNKTVSIVLGQ